MATDDDSAFIGPSPMTISSASRTVQFDAVLSRGHGRSASATQAPVEDGSTISDHVILDAETLQIDGVVSDHPIDDISLVEAAAAALTRSVEVAAILQGWWRAKTTLTVVTRLWAYEDMVIERLDWSESEESAAALVFSLALKRIRKARLETVQIDKLAAASSDLAAGAVHRGRQHPKTVAQAARDALKKGLANAGIPAGGITDTSATGLIDFGEDLGGALGRGFSL